MNKNSKFSLAAVAVFMMAVLSITGCSSPEKVKEDPVADNIKTYTYVWDEIMNRGKLDMFNDTHFTPNVVMHANPDITGIDGAREYYANFLTGFSGIQFTIVDVFGQGDKLVKHWRFTGTHTGDFFGIPATGKTVSLDGTTLVRMANGRIAEERDFFDNLDFMTQLGLIPPLGE